MAFKRSTSVQFASVVFKPENLSILAARNLAMNFPRLLVLASMLLSSVLMAATSEVSACFFEPHPLYCRGPLTLVEQLAESDAALLVRWVETKAPEGTFRGSSLFAELGEITAARFRRRAIDPPEHRQTASSRPQDIQRCREILLFAVIGLFT